MILSDLKIPMQVQEFGLNHEKLESATYYTIYLLNKHIAYHYPHMYNKVKSHKDKL